MAAQEDYFPFTRYRPYVVAFTGVCLTYSAFLTYQTWRDGNTGRSLRRRNAIRRTRGSRSGRPVGGPRREPDIADGAVIERGRGSDGTVAENFQLGNGERSGDGDQPASSAFYGMEFGSRAMLGQLTVEGRNGESIVINIDHREPFITHRLQSDFGFTPAEAESLREAVQLYFNPPTARDGLEANSSLRRRHRTSQQSRRGVTSDAVATMVDEPASQSLEQPLSSATDDEASVAQYLESDPERYGLNVDEGRGGNLKSMLYHIAAEQARREGYVHRGVACDSCDAKPIRGVRWRCVNCPDYDLCSDCEAVTEHPKTHIFYKVKIPAPFLGSPRQSSPVLYPGNPELVSDGLPATLKKRLMEELKYEYAEIDALWDQFTCLANANWPDDPNGIGAAIDRQAFDKSFVPHSSLKPAIPNLIYDRLFAVYDTDRDGLIGFEEFIRGLARLHSRNHSHKKHQVFDGYDLDGDGFVERKDFLRMFRAFYSVQKDIVKELLVIQEEDVSLIGAINTVMSSQPLSAAFHDHIYPTNDISSSGKPEDQYGDGQAPDIDVVAQDEEQKNMYSQADIFALSRISLSSSSKDGEEPGANEDVGQGLQDIYTRPHETVESNQGESTQSERNGGSSAAVSDQAEVAPDSSPEQQSQPVRLASSDQDPRGRSPPSGNMRDDESYDNDALLRRRWDRRQFYLDDEEGISPPPWYSGGGSESTTRHTGIEDSKPNGRCVSDNSQSMTPTGPASKKPVMFTLSESEKAISKEIIYQVTQQALNDILDVFFAAKEYAALEVKKTVELRNQLTEEIAKFTEMNHYIVIDGPRMAGYLLEQMMYPITGWLPDANHAATPVKGDTPEADSQLQHPAVFPAIVDSAAAGKEEDHPTPTVQRKFVPYRTWLSDSMDYLLQASGVGKYLEKKGHGTTAHSSFDKDGRDLLHNNKSLSQSRRNSVSALPKITVTDAVSAISTRTRRSKSEPVKEGSVLVPGQPARSTDKDVNWQSSDTPQPNVAPNSRSVKDWSTTDGQLDYENPLVQTLLARLTLLNAEERELEIKGGPGRLCFEEFETVMNEVYDGEMAYIDWWLEFASF